MDMSRQSVILFNNDLPTVICVGNPVRVDTMYTKANHCHTVSIAASNFRGRLTIQATIKAKPSENDWFPVSLGGQYHIDYPTSGIGQETSTKTFSFNGRFIWLRAITDKSLVIPLDAMPVMVGACGYIDRILLNI